MFKKQFLMYDANAAGGTSLNSEPGTNGDGNSAGSSTGDALTFEAWQEGLPPEHKTLIADHTKSLKSALESERGTRKDLEKQLRDLAKKSEEGSDAKTQLTKLADDLSAADRRADFYQSAHESGVKNLKLAYTVAVTDEMFDKHGRVNFDEMKTLYPELFAGTVTPPGNAGSGTNGGTNQTQTMDDFIRRKVNR